MYCHRKDLISCNLEVYFNKDIILPGDQLQKLSSKSSWAVADSLVLQSIAQVNPVNRGGSGKRLQTLVQYFSYLRLAYLLLFVVGLAELTKLLLQQRKSVSPIDEPSGSNISAFDPSCLFVGFGAGQEEKLFTEYSAATGMPVKRINQVQVETMGQWHRVSLVQGVIALLHSLTLARQAISSLPDEYKSRKNDFLTFVGMRLGQFSFASAWFKQLKKQALGLTEVCFLSPDTPAFAAVNAGLTTRFLQHGLIRHSLILPAFDYVDALTRDEARHFRQRLPGAVIQFTGQNTSPVVERVSNCILVASIYGQKKELQRIVPFLEYAAHKGMTIHVRPHPCEDQKFWQESDFPFEINIDDKDESFDAALDRIQPILVVSWFSTALVDSLYRDVLPVSVSALDDPNVEDMVYPLFKRCLHWPEQKGDLEKAISNEAYYEEILADLRAEIE